MSNEVFTHDGSQVFCRAWFVEVKDGGWKHCGVVDTCKVLGNAVTSQYYSIHTIVGLVPCKSTPTATCEDLGSIRK